MSNVISHTGTVDSITGNVVHVRIVQSSACSSCKVASYCTSTESKEKVIDVACNDARCYTIGEEVEVLAAQAVGTKAVLLAFVVPIICIMVTIMSLLSAGASEIVAAMAGIAVMLPYYIILYTLRNRIERVLTFSLRRI